MSKKKIRNNNTKSGIIKLDMTFEQAMKKALNTPLPKNKNNKKK